jgi:hypothetical protein
MRFNFFYDIKFQISMRDKKLIQEYDGCIVNC